MSADKLTESDLNRLPVRYSHHLKKRQSLLRRSASMRRRLCIELTPLVCGFFVTVARVGEI